MKLLTLMAMLAVTGSPAASRGQVPQPVQYRADLLIQIGVSNLDRAIAFYTGPLGFTLTERRNDLKFAHIETNLPGLQIGLNEVASPKGSGSIVLNIGVVNVKESRTRLEARGVTFRGDTIVIPGKVSLAEFSDPDGNILRFSGPPPPRAPEPQETKALACTEAAARSLDFWIGTWDVHNARGQLAATSRVEPLADGCGLLERYTGEPGPAGSRYIGAGLHAFDAASATWRQLWTDVRPGITEMQGRVVDGAVVYEWTVVEPSGARVAKRYTLSRDAAGVRQHGQRLNGATWVTEFDLKYTERRPDR